MLHEITPQRESLAGSWAFFLIIQYFFVHLSLLEWLLPPKRARGRSTIIWAWKAITDWEAITDWTRHWQQIRGHCWEGQMDVSSSVAPWQLQQLARKWQHNSRKKWWISFQMRWTDFREKQKSIMSKTDVFGQRASESKIDICKFRVGWSTIMQGVQNTQYLYICICICTTLKLYLFICICW